MIGSIDTAEFVVALGASAGFLVALGSEQINYAWVGALVVGGLVAAPIAAWLVRALPAHVLGLSVGTLIIITNSRTLLDAAGVDSDLTTGLFVVFGLGWLALLGVLLLRPRAVLQSADQARHADRARRRDAGVVGLPTRSRRRAGAGAPVEGQ